MINAFYEIDKVKTFDRDKSHYSRYYDFFVIKPVGNYSYYNVATKVDSSTNTKFIYLVLYKTEHKNTIKIKSNSRGWWKIKLNNHVSKQNYDYNIDLKFVEHFDNPECDIYNVSVI